MTFKISETVLAGSINSDKLASEIAASGAVSDFAGLIITGDEVTVTGAITNQALLLSTIQNHVPLSLAEKKALKVLAIDARTREIIAAGFAFDGQQFSLSAQAQTNWLGMLALQAILPWPLGVTTNLDTTYELAQANLLAFVGTGANVIKESVGSGRTLKIAANAAATQAELDAVVDNR